jgi:hypothetical protein
MQCTLVYVIVFLKIKICYRYPTATNQVHIQLQCCALGITAVCCFQLQQLT